MKCFSYLGVNSFLGKDISSLEVFLFELVTEEGKNHCKLSTDYIYDMVFTSRHFPIAVGFNKKYVVYMFFWIIHRSKCREVVKDKKQ